MTYGVHFLGEDKSPAGGELSVAAGAFDRASEEGVVAAAAAAAAPCCCCDGGAGVPAILPAFDGGGGATGGGGSGLAPAGWRRGGDGDRSRMIRLRPPFEGEGGGGASVLLPAVPTASDVDKEAAVGAVGAVDEAEGGAELVAPRDAAVGSTVAVGEENSTAGAPGEGLRFLSGAEAVSAL